MGCYTASVLLNQNHQSTIKYTRRRADDLRGGDWLSAFKFMGLLYDGNRGTVEGNTKGSRLKVDTRSAVWELIRVLRNARYPETDLQAISHSNVFGLFVSKLYNGTWTITDFEDHDWKVDPYSWYGPRAPAKGNALISSVACLWLRSAIDYSIHHGKRLKKLWEPKVIRGGGG